VRVYEASRDREVAYGWAYHFPVRGIRPGAPVLFWNRLLHTQTLVKVDFGDRTPPGPVGRETAHTYRAPGCYMGTFLARGPREEPVAVKLEGVVGEE
jgi:hypothetical protein